MTGVPLDRARVAELIVTRDGERQRGSGYRVRTDAVLTAAHVVTGASAVRIRFEPDLPGEWSVEATSWWSDPESDIAVVLIEPRAGEQLAPVRFGRVDDRAAVLAVEAVGFPLWKMRTDADARRYRDAVHAVGTVAVLSNWREGTLEVVVEPATAVAGEVSPWQGMSGAVLWANDHVVGVIARHHPGDGLGRLAASRVDLALDRVDPSRGTSLREVLAVVAPLPDVLPAPQPELITNAYQALVAETAPERLYDRDWELGELARFCAGAEPYLLWQAGPWAGKSALLAWFALHPPDGVDVVSFFIVGRLAGQSDSDAFTDALIDQLASLVGEPPGFALEARVRHGHLLRLLTTAAAGCAAAGRVLLLVVDGLDEDTSRADGVGRPSVAALLPRRPPPGLRVLVASRPHPDLPDDVPGDHPLRTVVPRTLSASPYARNLGAEAKRELGTLLAREGLHRELLGLITASGGGLTQPDLEELTGHPSFELDALFGGILGRSVGARAYGTESERVYLFTHDTLREQAERAFGRVIGKYRAQLHEWADGHRARGWAEDTPVYLFRGYPRLLAALGDVERLTAFALDRPRHDRMLAVTGGDALALTEIESAAMVLARTPDPDVLTLLRMCVARWELGQRNGNIPDQLPAVWARLGEVDRAVALVNSLTGVDIRARAFTKLISALVEMGDHAGVRYLVDDAEQAVRQISEPHWRYCALIELADELARGEEGERAQRMVAEAEAAVATVGESYRDELLTRLATHSVALGQDAEAVRFALDIGDHYKADNLLEELAKGTRPDTGRALRFLLSIKDLPARDTSLFELAVEAMTAGDDDALQVALKSSRPDSVLRELVDRALADGELRRAGRFAFGITEPHWRADALCSLAQTHLDNGDTEQAAKLTASAEALLPEISDVREQAVLLAELAGLLPARAAELLRSADDLVAAIENDHTRARVLSTMAAVFTGDGERFAEYADRAEACAVRATDLLIELARHSATARDHARARRLIESVLSPPGMTATTAPPELHLDVLRTAADIEAPDLVSRLLEHEPAIDLRAVLATASGDRAVEIATVIARHAPYSTSFEQIKALAALHEDDRALALARQASRWAAGRQLDAAMKLAVAAGEDDRALRFAADIVESYPRSSSLLEACMSLLEEGHLDRAVRYAADISFEDLRDTAFCEVAWAAGDDGRAFALLEEVSEPVRASGITVLAMEAASSGDVERARMLCETAEKVARVAVGADGLADLRVELVDVLAGAGDADRAERLARVVVDPGRRLEALLRVARRALESGDVDRARQVAAAAARIEREEDAWRFDSVVDVLLATGDVEGAERVVAELEVVASAGQRDDLYTALAVALAKLGRHEQAVECVAGISFVPDVFEALAAVARSAPDGELLGEVRATILRLVRDSEDHVLLDSWVVDGVGALAAIGRFSHALDLARYSDSPTYQVEAFTRLAQSAVADRDERRAQFAEWASAVGEMTDDYHRDEVYGTFAAVRDEDGEHDEALRLAGLVTDPAKRGEVLRDIRLRSIAEGRQTAAARQFVASVLATTGWLRALPAVAKMELGALQRFADEVLG